MIREKLNFGNIFNIKCFRKVFLIIFAPDMNEVHKRIIEESTRLFLKYGLRSVTMDDVSREMGISKKTLYNFVSNKAELVDQDIRVMFETISGHMNELAKQSDNAIDELFKIDEYFDVMMREQHPAMIFQLKKYYPKTFAWLDERKSKFVIDTTLLNLSKGIEQGLYLPDLNKEYLAYIYLTHTSVIESETIPREICESTGFHKAHLIYHIRGISSKKGLDYLKQKLNIK